ncbi:MAG TPA: DNA polymerase ligase N-terminal domain-containing protein [Pirellulales bacterium]|nr:DNA polymerase ligase N-terminal domain-containing protein [Pirellulales bacterium]
MPRFVVLRHDLPPESGRGLHWDLMLEAADVLQTWALAEEPSADAACLAERLPDHRRAYLDYEGEVSGGRGTVTRWDAGDYLPLPAEGESVVVELHGRRLRGTARLERPAADGQRWRFSFVEGAAASGRSGEVSGSDGPESRGTV